MRIVELKTDKKQVLDLLLLADEQESMIDRYLERGTLYALEDGGIQAVCVVTDEGGRTAEIKNLAVRPERQRTGLGRRMIRHVEEVCRGRYDTLLVGTGESPLTLPFYAACGFTYSHRVPNFFVDHYDHPVMECGKRLTDMIYLKNPSDRPKKRFPSARIVPGRRRSTPPGAICILFRHGL